MLVPNVFHLVGFPEPELVCGQDHLRLTVQKRLLEERGLNASSAHMIDPRCHQQVDQQEEMWYLVQRRQGICGNVVEVSLVKTIYKDILSSYNLWLMLASKCFHIQQT